MSEELNYITWRIATCGLFKYMFGIAPWKARMEEEYRQMHICIFCICHVNPYHPVLVVHFVPDLRCIKYLHDIPCLSTLLSPQNIAWRRVLYSIRCTFPLLLRLFRYCLLHPCILVFRLFQIVSPTCLHNVVTEVQKILDYLDHCCILGFCFCMPLE
jgi:hypothetical protein